MSRRLSRGLVTGASLAEHLSQVPVPLHLPPLLGLSVSRLDLGTCYLGARGGGTGMRRVPGLTRGDRIPCEPGPTHSEGLKSSV